MSHDEASYRDRIQVCDSKHDIYKDLTEGANPPFKTMKDAFMLAVCLGHQQKSRTPLEKKRGIFDWSVFSEQEDLPILYSIGIAEVQDINILVNGDHLLTIAEEYANTGILHLKQIVDEPGEPLYNLAGFFLTDRNSV